MSISTAAARLESEAGRLGTPARATRGVLSAVLTPAGWLLTPLHALLSLVTLGLWSSVWAAATLPLLGAATVTSRLWWRTPSLWPAWLLLGVPFVVGGYIVALLGPRWREGDERSLKLRAVRSWPYTYLALFEWDEGEAAYGVPTAAGAYDGLAPYEIGIPYRRDE